MAWTWRTSQPFSRSRVANVCRNRWQLPALPMPALRMMSPTWEPSRPAVMRRPSELMNSAGSFIEGQEPGAHFGEVFLDPAHGAVANGHVAVLVAFALLDADEAPVVIDIAKAEVAKLLAADAGRVEGFEDRPHFDAAGRLQVGHVR